MGVLLYSTEKHKLKMTTKTREKRNALFTEFEGEVFSTQIAFKDWRRDSLAEDEFEAESFCFTMRHCAGESYVTVEKQSADSFHLLEVGTYQVVEADRAGGVLLDNGSRCPCPFSADSKQHKLLRKFLKALKRAGEQ